MSPQILFVFDTRRRHVAGCWKSLTARSGTGTEKQQSLTTSHKSKKLKSQRYFIYTKHFGSACVSKETMPAYLLCLTASFCMNGKYIQAASVAVTFVFTMLLVNNVRLCTVNFFILLNSIVFGIFVYRGKLFTQLKRVLLFVHIHFLGYTRVF